MYLGNIDDIKQKSFEKAFADTEKLAQKGDKKAEFSLAVMYWNGRGVKKNYEKAFDIFKKLAKKGDKTAEYNLAIMYYKGETKKLDYKKGFNIFKKLSENGDDNAKYYLALMYYEGVGTEQSYEKAFNIFNELSKKNDLNFNIKLHKEYAKNTNFYIGEMYYLGTFVKKNYEKAKDYFMKFIELDNYESYYYGYYCEEEKYEKAFHFFDEMAKKGDVDAKYYLGIMYYEGLGIERSYEKAFNIFNELAENGNDYAKSELSSMYFEGLGTEKDYKKAYNLDVELFEKGYKFSSFNIGLMYYFGLSVEKDYAKAEYYFKKYIGKIYDVMSYIGLSVEKKYERSEYYFGKYSYTSSYDRACYYLYLISKDGGYGAKKDEKESQNYLYEVEKDLFKAITAYRFSIYLDNTYELEDWIKILNYNKKELRNILSTYLLKTHPSISYFCRLRGINNDQYRLIAEDLKERIKIFYSRENQYFSFINTGCIDDLDILAEIIFFSSKYKSMEEYFSYRVENETNGRMAYALGRALLSGKNCKRNVKRGIKLIEKSALEGYSGSIDMLVNI